jgi:deferrochelatase/peroxidase EfeB
VPVQLALARNDSMMEYLRHTGSAIWACPPGVAAGGWWGETLFTSA